MVLEGFPCRYKTLEDGRRQIVSFLLPGDICDARMFILKQMDHSIGTLSPAKLAEIPGELFLELTDRSPRIAREWTRNVGQRTAYERMAHLLCEFLIRPRIVGLVNGTGTGTGCEPPITQTEFADALGMSTVHTNRTLQELRSAGLITLKGKMLAIPDLDALQDAALFNPNYLHFDRSGQSLDANDP